MLTMLIVCTIHRITPLANVTKDLELIFNTSGFFFYFKAISVFVYTNTCISLILYIYLMYDIKITTLDDLTISKVNFIKQVSVSFVIIFLSSTLTRKKYV